MALQKDYYEPRYEVTIKDCYWKVEEENGISGGKSYISVRINCFKNKQIADTNNNKYSDFDFSFIPDMSENAPNFIQQAYLYAKALPEFVNAIDV